MLLALKMINPWFHMAYLLFLETTTLCWRVVGLPMQRIVARSKTIKRLVKRNWNTIADWLIYYIH